MKSYLHPYILKIEQFLIRRPAKKCGYVNCYHNVQHDSPFWTEEIKSEAAILTLQQLPMARNHFHD